MPDDASILSLPTHDLLERDGRPIDEEANAPATTGIGYLPPSAQRCRVSSLQHWIDLCA
jgi:hypothetical protein